MLNLIMHYYYKYIIYTDEKEIFYNFYKWRCGLIILLRLRILASAITFLIIALIFLFLQKPIYCLLSLNICMLLIFLELIERYFKVKETISLKLENFIRKFVTMSGRALGWKEWKIIKQRSNNLYNELLCNECDRCCYYYSLAIARIIKDSVLIWGAVQEPFEDSNNYYAHAVILRNGYIYDSNMRQSEKLEDFIKLYKFKQYKQWTYDVFSQRNFRDIVRSDFVKWCKENNVKVYEMF